MARPGPGPAPGRRSTAPTNLPPAEASGPSRDQLEHELDTTYNVGYQHVLTTLESHRYYRLLDALEHFRETPPAKAKAARKDRKARARFVNKTARRFDKAHRAATRA